MLFAKYFIISFELVIVLSIAFFCVFFGDLLGVVADWFQSINEDFRWALAAPWVPLSLMGSRRLLMPKQCDQELARLPAFSKLRTWAIAAVAWSAVGSILALIGLFSSSSLSMNARGAFALAGILSAGWASWMLVYAEWHIIPELRKSQM